MPAECDSNWPIVARCLPLTPNAGRISRTCVLRQASPRSIRCSMAAAVSDFEIEKTGKTLPVWMAAALARSAKPMASLNRIAPSTATIVTAPS